MTDELVLNVPLSAEDVRRLYAYEREIRRQAAEEMRERCAARAAEMGWAQDDTDPQTTIKVAAAIRALPLEPGE